MDNIRFANFSFNLVSESFVITQIDNFISMPHERVNRLKVLPYGLFNLHSESDNIVCEIIKNRCVDLSSIDPEVINYSGACTLTRYDISETLSNRGDLVREVLIDSQASFVLPAGCDLRSATLTTSPDNWIRLKTLSPYEPTIELLELSIAGDRNYIENLKIFKNLKYLWLNGLSLEELITPPQLETIYTRAKINRLDISNSKNLVDLDRDAQIQNLILTPKQKASISILIDYEEEPTENGNIELKFKDFVKFKTIYKTLAI